MACVQSMPPPDPQELRKILRKVDNINPMIALMLEMSALTGLRYSDCSKLKITDVTINGVIRNSITIVQQKSYSKRVSSGMSNAAAKKASQLRISLVGQVNAVIADALHLNPGGTMLFESEKVRGTTYTPQYINRILKRVAFDLKLSYPLSTHSFRKSFALMLINSGAKAHAVRDLLGHSSLAVTDHYLSTFMSDNDELVAKLTF